MILKGFQGIFIDRPKNLVMVSGSINTEYLVKKLKKKLKKSVKIVKQEKYEDDLKPIWFPNYYNYWPESDQFVHDEAKYCTIMWYNCWCLRRETKIYSNDLGFNLSLICLCLYNIQNSIYLWILLKLSYRRIWYFI